MTLRPFQSSAESQNSAQSRENALHYEIVQEQAATLGRLGRALETALAALRRHECLRAAPGGQNAAKPAAGLCAERAKLVQEASYALWCFVIQREVCGLRDPQPILRAYGVPPEVYNRMGVFGG